MDQKFLRRFFWNQQNGLFKEKKCRHVLSNYYSYIKTQIFNPELIQENIQNSFVEIGADSLSISLLCLTFNQRGIYLDSSTVYNHLQRLLINKHLIYDQIIQDIN